MNTLREALQDYLALRRGLGFKMRDAGLLLPRFVAFMEKRHALQVLNFGSLHCRNLSGVGGGPDSSRTSRKRRS